MTREQFERLWRLLDRADDYLGEGVRRRHPDPPEQPVGAASTARARPGVQNHTAAAAGAVGGRPVADHSLPPGSRTGSSRVDHPGASGPPGDSSADGSRREELAKLHEEVTACTLCPLHRGRTQAVPGTGVLEPLVMVVGEGPGADEDRQGLPFVGRAGRYLDDWLTAIELSRSENVYITNVVKCRPPDNRDPLPQEWGACNGYLKRQIALLQPQALLAVGRVASGVLTGSSEGIGRLRGRVHSYEGIPLVTTYHPSGVLRNPAWRRPVWEDLKQLRALLSR